MLGCFTVVYVLVHYAGDHNEFLYLLIPGKFKWSNYDDKIGFGKAIISQRISDVLWLWNRLLNVYTWHTVLYCITKL